MVAALLVYLNTFLYITSRSVRAYKSEVLEVSFEGPAEGHHLLAADDARLLYPRKHEALEEAALEHTHDVSDPEQ